MKRLLLVGLMACLAMLPLQAQDEGYPVGQVGVPYFFDFDPDDEIFGGDEDVFYSFSIVGGALPPGLTLAPQGVISGIPSQPGVFSFTLRLTLGINDPEDRSASVSMRRGSSTSQDPCKPG